MYEVIRDEQNNIVGTIDEETFRMRARSALHPKGWSLPNWVIEKLRANNVTKLHVYDSDMGRTYNTSLDSFMSNCSTEETKRGKVFTLAMRFW